MNTDLNIERLLQLVRTARHLSLRQATALVKVRLAKRQIFDPAGTGSAGRSVHWASLVDCSREIDAGAAVRCDSVEVGKCEEFRFLNRSRCLPIIDWSEIYESPLWTYHLHYFDYAVDLARACKATGDPAFLDCYQRRWTSWLEAWERGEVRYEPYPTSRRCLNAMYSMWLLEEDLEPAFSERLLAATHTQLAWLNENIERHLRANHLQKNLTALAWGALAFDASTVGGRLRFLDELWEEFREQVLPDGGHFERSPMYHAAVLDDFLRTVALCEAAGVAVPTDVRPRLIAMARVLQWLSRPDGTMHLFNDTASGERPGREEVLDLARRLLGEDFVEPTGAFALPDTGYYGVIDRTSGTRLVIDAGPLGPSYQPGHAHCDMLSFELDLGGRPVVVDSGLHGYDGDPFREYVRSTRAHNTVTIDGRDQHEMWATFRVARRGEIVEARWRETSLDGFEFEGACRPYHDRRALHTRSIELRGERLTVSDRVEGADGRPLASWLHLHPDFRLEATNFGFLAVSDTPPWLTIRIELFGEDESRVWIGEREPIQGWYCPAFGIATPASVIEVRPRTNERFGWSIQPA